MAMVAIGPMPGRTPMSVPISAPMKAKSRLSGVMATPKPMARLWTSSIGLELGPEGDRQRKPDDEDQPAQDEQDERGNRRLQRPHVAPCHRADADEEQDRQHETEPRQREAEHHEAQGDEDDRTPRGPRVGGC